MQNQIMMHVGILSLSPCTVFLKSSPDIYFQQIPVWEWMLDWRMHYCAYPCIAFWGKKIQL